MAKTRCTKMPPAVVSIGTNCDGNLYYDTNDGNSTCIPISSAYDDLWQMNISTADFQKFRAHIGVTMQEEFPMMEFVTWVREGKPE